MADGVTLRKGAFLAAPLLSVGQDDGVNAGPSFRHLLQELDPILDFLEHEHE